MPKEKPDPLESQALGKSPVPERQTAREGDAEFAHTAALVLNRLIKEGVLTSRSVSNASREAMEEFIVRFEDALEPPLRRREVPHPVGVPAYDEHGRELLKTIFGIPRREQEGGAEGNPGREETIKLMESVLKRLRQRGLPIEGFLLYGSRMDPEKAPRGVEAGERTPWSRVFMSDIDALAIVDPLSNVDWASLREELTDAAWEFRQENPNIPQINAEPISRSRFLGEFMGGDEPGDAPLVGVPFWSWKPDVPLYIGWPLSYWSQSGTMELHDYPPEEVNARLQAFLNSNRLRAAKDEIISAIKEAVEGEFKAVQQKPFAPI